MLSYLQKFNSLPKNIKDAVSSPVATARIIALGIQYKVELAPVVMKIVTKELTLDNLGAYLVNQLSISADLAKSLEKDLRQQVFASVIDFLLSPSNSPQLVFDVADEKEVKAVAKPMASIDFDQAVEEALERVVTKSHIGMDDPLVGGKFRQVIKTYLRGTRDRSSTLEALTKAAELGGVSLSRDAAERALGSATLELSALTKTTTAPIATKIPVPEDTVAKPSPFKKIATPEEYNLASEIAKNNLVPLVKEKPKEIILDTDHEIAPPTPVVVQQKEISAPVRTIVKEAISGKPLNKTSLRKVTEAVKPKTIVNFSTSDTGRIRMDDIRYTPQTVSPVDELRFMSLKQFRRLNPNPVKAIERIKEKLEFLGKEDYGKKIEGIVAWHESPMSNLYIQLCRRALDENKPVTDILRDELKRNPDSLKNDELSAIIALNQDLKF